MTSVATASCSIAPSAARVLPAPVGNAITPRSPAERHASTASRWYQRSSGSDHWPSIRPVRISSVNRTPASESRARVLAHRSAGNRHAASSSSHAAPTRIAGSRSGSTRSSTTVPRSNRIRMHGRHSKARARAVRTRSLLLRDARDLEATRLEQRHDALLADQVIGADGDEHVALLEQLLELGDPVAVAGEHELVIHRVELGVGVARGLHLAARVVVHAGAVVGALAVL